MRSRNQAIWDRLTDLPVPGTFLCTSTESHLLCEVFYWNNLLDIIVKELPMLLAFERESFLSRVVLYNWLVTWGWKDPSSLWESWIDSLVVHQVIQAVSRLHVQRDHHRLWEGQWMWCTYKREKQPKNPTQKNSSSHVCRWWMLPPKVFEFQL